MEKVQQGLFCWCHQIMILNLHCSGLQHYVCGWVHPRLGPFLENGGLLHQDLELLLHQEVKFLNLVRINIKLQEDREERVSTVRNKTKKLYCNSVVRVRGRRSIMFDFCSSLHLLAGTSSIERKIGITKRSAKMCFLHQVVLG